MSRSDIPGVAGAVEEPSFLVDYDVTRWARIPRDPASVDMRKWARRAAEAWAEDTYHEGDRQWTALLRKIFERAVGARLTDEPDALFLHILSPIDGPPSVQMVTLRLLPTEGDLDTDAGEAVTAFSRGAVGQPTDDAVVLSSGAPARVITSHQVQDDGSVLTNLDVLWQPAEGVLGVVGGGSYSTGRLAAARDDMVALAGATQVLRPGDAVPGASGAPRRTGPAVSPRGQGRAFELGQRLGSPMNIYWFYDRIIGRWLSSAGLLVALPGIPVAVAHGVPMPAAGPVGAVLAVALLTVGVAWRRPWSVPALASIAVLLFWPAAVWAPWAFFAGLYVAVLAFTAMLWRHSRDSYLRMENAWRAQDGRPPYVISQEAIALAYRAGRG